MDRSSVLVNVARRGTRDGRCASQVHAMRCDGTGAREDGARGITAGRRSAVRGRWAARPTPHPTNCPTLSHPLIPSCCTQSIHRRRTEILQTAAAVPHPQKRNEKKRSSCYSCLCTKDRIAKYKFAHHFLFERSLHVIVKSYTSSHVQVFFDRNTTSKYSYYLRPDL